jgi:hypothetical protein
MQRSYNEGTLSKARADGGIYGCPRNPEAIRCNKLNPLDGSDCDILAKLVWNPDKEHGEADRRNAQEGRHDRPALRPRPAGHRHPNLSYIRDQVQTRDRLTLAHRYAQPRMAGSGEMAGITHAAGAGFRRIRNRPLPMARMTGSTLLNYKEKFTEGDIQMNSSFKTFIATHKLTYGAYASVADTDYQRRDVTTNLTTEALRWPTPAGSISRTPRHIASTASFRMRSCCSTMLSLTPGVRYATCDLDRGQTRLCRQTGNEPKQIQSEKLVKQFGAVYKTTDNISLVGRYAEGFKMPRQAHRCRMWISIRTSSRTQGSGPSRSRAMRPAYAASSAGLLLCDCIQGRLHRLHSEFVPVPSVNFPGFNDLTTESFQREALGIELRGVSFHETGPRRVVRIPKASSGLTQRVPLLRSTARRRFKRVRTALQSAARV